MSGAQHLIENAIMCIENGKIYDDFSNACVNKTMSDVYGIALEDVWSMAMYVVYTTKRRWVGDVIAVLQGETPFDLEMREYVEKYL